MTDRGQTAVVGVAVLLAVTAVSLGVLTATAGMVVEEHADRAATTRAATDLGDALAPVAATGTRTGRLDLSTGRLRSVERDLRVYADGRPVERLRVGGLVYTVGDHRVGYVAGALVRGTGAGATLERPPPVTASRSTNGGALVVGTPQLGTDRWTVSGEGSVTLRTNVTHERTDLGRANLTVAVETRTPAPLGEWFERQGASVSVTDIDGDGVESVVADYPGRRRAYLVVHDLSLEVSG